MIKFQVTLEIDVKTGAAYLVLTETARDWLKRNKRKVKKIKVV